MGQYFATPQTHDGDGHAPPPQPQQPEELLQPLPEICEGFTCEICIEPIESSKQTFRPKNANCAGHRFCNECMIKYIEAKLDDNIPEMPCPAPTCPEFLDPDEYWVLVGPPLFVRWCDALCEAALVGMERCYCPNRNYSELVVNECGAAAVKKAACPACKRAFCFQCKLPWHAGFRCEESGELMDQNDRAFGILAEEKNWTRCPQCHHFVELRRGCRFIKCRCHAHFCHRCGGFSRRCACILHRRNNFDWSDRLFRAIYVILFIVVVPLVLKFC